MDLFVRLNIRFVIIYLIESYNVAKYFHLHNVLLC